MLSTPEFPTSPVENSPPLKIMNEPLLASDAVEPSAAFWRVLGATEAEAKEGDAAG